jgi:hypothetical protein
MQTSGERAARTRSYVNVIASHRARISRDPVARNDDLEIAVIESISRGVLEARPSRGMTVVWRLCLRRPAQPIVEKRTKQRGRFRADQARTANDDDLDFLCSFVPEAATSRASSPTRKWKAPL